MQYILKLKANHKTPVYDVVFSLKHQDLYKSNETSTYSSGIHGKTIIKEANIDVREIVINSIPNVPIWDSEPVSADFTLSQFD